LLDEIVDRLDNAIEPEFDQAFLEEIKRRFAAYDRGEVETRDAREVLRKYKKQ
jgi:putative addiction module component